MILDGAAWAEKSQRTTGTNHCLVFLFKLLFATVFFPQIFSHSAPEEGLYRKPKYRAILFKVI